MSRRNVVGGQSRFAQTPSANVQRSAFKRSCSVKTTFDAGALVPIFVDEVLPGDTFSCKLTTFARLATPLHPTMDNIWLDYFFFFVPNRLVWVNWAKFNGEQVDPGDSTSFTIPTVTSPDPAGFAENSLWDYMGIPTKVANLEVSALYTRAYNLIWNEFFRDENLQNSAQVDTDNGPDTFSNYVVQERGKRHDYFTSCLPWPQKGTAVELPLGTTAPLSYGVETVDPSGDETPVFSFYDSKTNVLQTDGVTDNVNLGQTASGTDDILWSDPKLEVDLTGGTADLSTATAATINELREAFQIQRLYERDARGGTRYTEILRSHFGVISPDARLQRPEYLGGGTNMIQIAPVAQTSETSTTPLATLAGVGVGGGSGGAWNKSFTEHGMIIGLVCCRGDMAYQQGVNRMFTRSTRWDFYWPALAHLGEQEVLGKEIYFNDDAGDTAVFGYQERYAEYRYKPSYVCAQFRSNAATPLDSWHLAYEFSARPLLNAAFIEEQPPIDRIIAVPSEPHVLLDAYFDLQCARPMPVFSVPGLIDHF